MLCVCACKKESNEDKINEYPEEVRDLVREFLADGKTYGNKNLKLKKLSFNLMKDKAPICPDCPAFYYKNVIYIDTTSFYYKTRKTETIYHELGHAILKREHDNEVLQNGLQKSLMNKYFSSDFYGNRDYYLNELFN